jgi:hypothetical protein
MPQVGGDPIVESGSNADGEWTRWSDGTQVVHNAGVALSLSANAFSSVVTFPVAFYLTDSIPSILVTIGSEASVAPRWDSSDDRDCVVSSRLADASKGVLVFMKPGNGGFLGTTGVFSYVANGRWK